MKIMLMHIPKTGITSIANMFMKMFGEEKVQRLIMPNHRFYIRDPKSLFWTDRGLFDSMWRKWMTEQYDEFKNKQVLWGHHPVYLLKEFFPNHTFITWMRDPIALQTSWYYWNKTRPNWKASETMKGHLGKFIYNDIQFSMMDGSTSNFDFVGLHEFMEEDISWMLQLIGWEEKRPLMQYHNIQPADYGREIYSDTRLLLDIRANNTLDMELWKSVVERR